jgi:CMP-N-acetylneuraminic acid synthetase
MLTAVIPVKGTSSRLPGKNTLPFNGETLLSHKIRNLKNTPGVDRIVVSSDSKEMLGIAESVGVEAILRPSFFADESRPFAEFVRYVASIVDDGDILWACVTSPLITAGLFSKVIPAYYEALDDGFDSLITVYPFQHYLLDETGPLNFKIGTEHVNSQNLPSWSLFTNGAVVAPKSIYLNLGSNWGPRPLRFEVSQMEAIDIDTHADYVAAKAFWAEISGEGLE